MKFVCNLFLAMFLCGANIAVAQKQKVTEMHSPMETAELTHKIEAAIAALPEKCRMVFELNRIEGLKYAEIAAKMNISVKTVEAQMSKALATMKEHLSEFLTLIFLFLT